MNKTERLKVVRAMETIARCINDEDIFDAWLMCGVADGDIREDTPDEYIEYYADDNTFKDLMSLFTRIISRANKSGGLYCDDIVSEVK